MGSLLLSAALSSALSSALAAEPEVLALVPVQLQSPHLFSWASPAREVREGFVYVLRVEPTTALPRQGPHPVLYVGALPAERLSWTAPSDRLVVFAPGPLDPAAAAVFWGDARLPEQVDAAHGAAQAAAAAQRGIRPAAPSPGERRVLPGTEALYALGAELERQAP